MKMGIERVLNENFLNMGGVGALLHLTSLLLLLTTQLVAAVEAERPSCIKRFSSVTGNLPLTC